MFICHLAKVMSSLIGCAVMLRAGELEGQGGKLRREGRQAGKGRKEERGARREIEEKPAV